LSNILHPTSFLDSLSAVRSDLWIWLMVASSAGVIFCLLLLYLKNPKKKVRHKAKAK